MATAKVERELTAQGKGCLGKAADDEPVFILRGQDILASRLVQMWANEARLRGCPEEKVEEALALSAAMKAWRPQKLPD